MRDGVLRYSVYGHAGTHVLAHRHAVAETVGVTNVVEEAAALGKSARRHLAQYEADMARLRELLPLLRTEAKLGPKEIEELIGGVYERGTISRRTAEAAGTSRKTPAGS
jgi:hypothetical protein